MKKSVFLFGLLCIFSTQTLLANDKNELTEIFSASNQIMTLSSSEMKNTQGSNLTSIINTQMVTSIAQSNGFISTSIALANSNGASLAVNMPVNINISPIINKVRRN